MEPKALISRSSCRFEPITDILTCQSQNIMQRFYYVQTVPVFSNRKAHLLSGQALMPCCEEWQRHGSTFFRSSVCERPARYIN